MNLGSRKTWLARVLPLTAVAALVTGGIIAIAPSASASVPFEVESLDGGGNNVAHPTWGQAGQPYARVGHGSLRRWHRPAGQRAQRPLDQQPHLQRHERERVLRAPGQPVGLAVGPVPRPHLRAARGGRADRDRDEHRVQRERPAGVLHQHARRRSRSTARPQTPGTGTGTSNPRQQTNTLPRYLRRQHVYGTTDDPAGLAARRSARRRPDQQQRRR